MVLSSWQSHCESSPGLFDESRMAPSGRRPKTKPDNLGCESACTGCQKLHPPSPFIITQPESWYSFYRPTEGRRLSRPSWLVTYRVGLSVHRRSPIRVLTGSDVAQLLHLYEGRFRWPVSLYNIVKLKREKKALKMSTFLHFFRASRSGIISKRFNSVTIFKRLTLL